MEEWDYIEVEGEKMEGYCMYSYRSEKVHIFYRMNKGLTEIQEVIREKIKTIFQRQRGRCGVFFQISGELQKINATPHTARFWHTVKRKRTNKT